MTQAMLNVSAPTPTATLAVIPTMIAIASGKGGVGKTWVAATMAQAFSFSGRRTLLIDGDLGLANVDVQLGLEPKSDIADAVSGRTTFADAVTPVTGGAGARGGFDVLAGRSGSATLSHLNPAEWSRLLRGVSALSSFYDVSILDLGAGVDGMVLNLALSAGTILVVLTDEPTSLTDAYALIKRLAQSGRAIGIQIVVNMASDHSEGHRTASTLIKAARGFLNLDVSIAGIIRRDTKVREAIRRQQPFLARHPQSQAAADVTALAHDMCRKLAETAALAPVRLSAGLR